MRRAPYERITPTGRGGGELVFGRTASQAFYASTVDGRAKRAWAAANDLEREAAEAADREPALFRPITLHECRHTFASLLIDSGANPKAIQNFMGHSKIQTTFDVYGHLLPGSRDDVRKRMDAYLSTDK
jgi:integrase